MAKPLILVTNDDGITSKGIFHLIAAMKEIGEVIVVAPDRPQSGMGHAITVNNFLRVTERPIFGDIRSYECTGTPADCVKIARHSVLKNAKQPDLVVSGVNHGSNSSISILYSGTMSAAIEAAIERTPAIGFSLCDYGPDPDFSHTSDVIRKITCQILQRGIPSGVSLNVNFPKKGKEELKGIRVCRQANAKWVEEFEQRHDPAVMATLR